MFDIDLAIVYIMFTEVYYLISTDSHLYKVKFCYSVWMIDLSFFENKIKTKYSSIIFFKVSRIRENTEKVNGHLLSLGQLLLLSSQIYSRV